MKEGSLSVYTGLIMNPRLQVWSTQLASKVSKLVKIYKWYFYLNSVPHVMIHQRNFLKVCTTILFSCLMYSNVCMAYVLGCSDSFRRHVSFLDHLTKLNNVLQIWNKPKVQHTYRLHPSMHSNSTHNQVAGMLLTTGSWQLWTVRMEGGKMTLLCILPWPSMHSYNFRPNCM